MRLRLPDDPVTVTPAPAGHARARVLGAAVLFSTGGLAIKLCTLTAWQIACARSAVAAAALALCVPAVRRAWSSRTLLVALPYALTVVLFTLANRSTTAANSIFLQDTAPLYVLLLGPWLLGERLQRHDAGFITLMLAGLLLLYLGTRSPLATAPAPALGNLLATVAGASWALTLVGLRWLAAGPRGSAAVSLAGALAGNLLAALVTLPLAWPVETFAAADVLLVAWLGLFQVALAYVLITGAMPRLPALESALLLLAEPVLVPVWAWLVLGEPTAPLALAGGALVLAGTALHAWQRRAQSGS